MTQEDKAKRYDEVLKRAKQLLETSVAYDRFTIEKIFPELKESEDEQIRKELLEHCINRRDGKQVCVDANDYRRWADWLEKQGQSKKTSIWKHWKDGIAGNGDGIPVFLIKNGLTYSLSPCLSFECDYIELSELDSLMLEKQGKQKPQGKTALEAIKKEYNTIDPHPFKAEHFYVSKVDGKIHDMTYNPADKVEPKFKVGDWVVSNLDGKARQISEVHFDEYNSYYVVEGKSVNLEEYDRLYHLWTIQDAKDGDVLATLDYILVFKEFLKNDGGISYCHYDFGAGNPQFVWLEDKNWYFGKRAIIHPATKEQRDLLFQKMKEAGYEWDVEKKELKKIEYDSTFKMKTPEESLGIDSDTYNKIVDECIYGEQKPAWSEEDEINYNYALAACKYYGEAKGYTDTETHQKTNNWLKSLKERMKGK